MRDSHVLCAGVPAVDGGCAHGVMRHPPLGSRYWLQRGRVHSAFTWRRSSKLMAPDDRSWRVSQQSIEARRPRWRPGLTSVPNHWRGCTMARLYSSWVKMIQSQIAFAGTPQGNIKTQEIDTTADFGVSRQFWATRITGNDSIIKTIVI